MRSFILFFILFSLAVFSDSRARWAEKADMDSEVLSLNWTVSVNEDGSYTSIETVKRRILTERGRSDFNVLLYAYDQTTSDLQIEHASTEVEGQHYPVDHKDIERKPLASDPMGLTKRMQIMIPLQHVCVGAIISTTTKHTYLPQDISKYFSQTIALTGEYIHKAHIHIDSKLPLKTKVIDPRLALKIDNQTNAHGTILDINLKEPTLIGMIMEAQSHFLDTDSGLSVEVSTEENYTRIATHYAKRYQDICAQTLPKTLEEIVSKAKTYTDETDQMEEAIAGLIQKIHYLGSWNSAEGHYFPRDLATICMTGFGDCKEYSVCLVGILRALGFKADPAFVNRGEVSTPSKIEGNVASLSDFNHVIVKAISPKGDTYWLDPTNQVAMAKGLFSDIADRQALVLRADPKTDPLETIPPIDPTHAVMTRESQVSFTSANRILTETTMLDQGESAIANSAALHHNPHDVIKESLIQSSCNSSDPLHPEVLLPEHNGCKVSDKKIQLRFEEDVSPLRTNLGPAFPLYSHWAAPFLDVKKSDIGSVNLGYPETLIRKKLYKGKSMDNPKTLEFSITTPWFKADRKVENTSEGVLITESYVNLVSIIPAADLKTPEFESAQNTLRQYCDVALILK